MGKSSSIHFLISSPLTYNRTSQSDWLLVFLYISFLINNCNCLICGEVLCFFNTVAGLHTVLLDFLPYLVPTFITMYSFQSTWLVCTLSDLSQLWRSAGRFCISCLNPGITCTDPPLRSYPERNPERNPELLTSLPYPGHLNEMTDGVIFSSWVKVGEEWRVPTWANSPMVARTLMTTPGLGSGSLSFRISAWRKSKGKGVRKQNVIQQQGIWQPYSLTFLIQTI